MSEPLAVEWRNEASGAFGAFRWGRAGDRYVAEWGAGRVTAHVALDGSILSVVPGPDTSSYTVERMRFGVVAAFARALQGRPSLHASAVSVGDHAVLFVGPSGSGKSTLVRELCRRLGTAFLADDVTGLELRRGHWYATPSERLHWLVDPTDVERKQSAAPLAVASEAATVGAIVHLRLDEATEVGLSRITGAEAFGALSESVLRFEAGPEVWLKEFEFLSALRGQARILRLARSKASPTLAESVSRLDELLRMDTW